MRPVELTLMAAVKAAMASWRDSQLVTAARDIDLHVCRTEAAILCFVEQAPQLMREVARGTCFAEEEVARGATTRHRWGVQRAA
jgi:hypothetical protein